MGHDPVVEQAARAAARRLAPDYGPQAQAQVEAALYGAEEQKVPDQYFDPVAIGGLIVAIADLAWTVYSDLKSRGEKPTQDGVARKVRTERHREAGLSDGDLKIIETVTTEVIEYGDRSLP